MNALANLQASQAALATSIDNAIAAVQAYVAANPNNSTAIQAVADSLTADKAKLDAAVSALSTPAV